jgi:hypothetical protein
MNVLLFQVPASSVQFTTNKEESCVQEWRLQRGAGQCRQEEEKVPAGHLHHTRGRPVAMDSPRVRAQLPSLLAGVRDHLVAHRVLARRPQSGEQQEDGGCAQCDLSEYH